MIKILFDNFSIVNNQVYFMTTIDNKKVKFMVVTPFVKIGPMNGFTCYVESIDNLFGKIDVIENTLTLAVIITNNKPVYTLTQNYQKAIYKNTCTHYDVNKNSIKILMNYLGKLKSI